MGDRDLREGQQRIARRQPQTAEDYECMARPYRSLLCEKGAEGHAPKENNTKFDKILLNKLIIVYLRYTIKK